MKVVFRPQLTMVHTIERALVDASARGLEVEKIVLSAHEFRLLQKELGFKLAEYEEGKIIGVFLDTPIEVQEKLI
jgi:hypothetical protein